MMNACDNDDDEPCVYLSQQVEDAMDSSYEELQDDADNLSEEEETKSVSDLSTNDLYHLISQNTRLGKIDDNRRVHEVLQERENGYLALYQGAQYENAGGELSAEEKRELQFNIYIDMRFENYVNSGPPDKDEDPAEIVGSWKR